MRRKMQDKPKADAVPSDKTKMSFSITFTGEVDWNRDFAGDGIDYWFHGGGGVDAANFKRAFQSSVADMVFDRVDRIFDNAKLVSLDCSDDVRAAFKKWVEEHHAKSRKELEAELAETEARKVELQKRLGK